MANWAYPTNARLVQYSKISHVSHHINKLRGKNMTTFRKNILKIQLLLMRKTLNKLELEGINP